MTYINTVVIGGVMLFLHDLKAPVSSIIEWILSNSGPGLEILKPTFYPPVYVFV